MNPQLVSVDIGGSHISSAIVNISEGAIHNDRINTAESDTYGSKDSIIGVWLKNIEQTANHLITKSPLRITIAIPGPFDYSTGDFLLHPEGKMKELVGLNFRDILCYHFGTDTQITFENDAACFGLGEACLGSAKDYKRVIGITLGTGIGSSFINGKKIIKSGEGVPKDGEIYSAPFLSGIADDYFSTRWFLQESKRELGLDATGVKELIEIAPEDFKHSLFHKFNMQFYNCLLPYALAFDAEAIVMGGNISKAWPMFSEELIELFNHHEIEVFPTELHEVAIMLGASQVYME